MLRNFTRYLTNIMADSQGQPSSKRWVTLIATLMMIIGYFASLFWNYTVDEFMYESIMYVVIAGLGITGAEKFAPSKVNVNDLEDLE